MKQKLFAFFAIAALLLGMSACTNDDNPSSGEEGKSVIPAQLKQGIWTEYDEALLTSGKYTEEQLAAMPSVGMKIEGDKAYFFTYTAEDASEPVEGKISYNKSTGEGTITFPAIKDNPLSGQKVNFTATSDETMQFELTYEGQKTTATFAWLCENLDNWSSDITDEDWKALMAYYELIAEDAGPDASIDWSGSEVVTVEDVDDEGNIVKKVVTVTDLDKPLVWDEDAMEPAKTRAIGIGTVISMGLKVFSSLFSEDPYEKINAKLDAALGKLDQALANQQQMMAQLGEINARLIAIAQMMKQQEAVNIFNNRTQTYYNPLKVRNTAYFAPAFKLYNDNKSDLSQVQSKLGEYAKTWVGNNEEYITLTWNYIEYLKSVQHSSYGTGMDRIYDGLTFDKYPWEHLGTGDRQDYRAYDMIMIAKSLFMINLYAAYGGLSDIKKEGLYNNYNNCKPTLKEFCEFTVANPDEFRVCQIPGAHFVMHKELQKYNYCGKDNKAPDIRDRNSAYRPEWHEAGSIKIDNPMSMKEKLIRVSEATAIYKYYQSLYNKERIWWYEMLVEGGEKAAGAVYSKKPSGVSNNRLGLLLYLHDQPQDNGIVEFGGTNMRWVWLDRGSSYLVLMGTRGGKIANFNWGSYFSFMEYYAAIVEERY